MERMKDILETIGEAAVFEQLAEECAELCQASLKVARNIRGENPSAKTKMQLIDDFLEEVADVDNMLSLAAKTEIYDGHRVARNREQKMARWEQRLAAGSDGPDPND